MDDRSLFENVDKGDIKSTESEIFLPDILN